MNGLGSFDELLGLLQRKDDNCVGVFELGLNLSCFTLFTLLCVCVSVCVCECVRVLH